MRLVIEISEDTLLSDIQHSGDIVRMLRMIGIQIAIDDFGSGNTGLGMLRSIPVDFIKMDKSLIREAADSHEGRVILKKLPNCVATSELPASSKVLKPRTISSLPWPVAVIFSKATMSRARSLLNLFSGFMRLC